MLLSDLPGHTRQAGPSGFRGYRAETLQTLVRAGVRSHGYSFLVEILSWCHRAGYRIVEEPVIYSERRRGQSKMSKWIMIEAALNPWRLWVEYLLGRRDLKRYRKSSKT